MGIVGALLAGGCPYPAGQSAAGALFDARGAAARGGAKVTVGSSVSSGKAEGKANGKAKAARIASPVEKENTRVLVVAPSNAAVDELVLRLCQEGVPGADGGVFYPKVVRVGGPRGEYDQDREGGGGLGVGALGVKPEMRGSSSVVQVCVCLCVRRVRVFVVCVCVLCRWLRYTYSGSGLTFEGAWSTTYGWSLVKRGPWQWKREIVLFLKQCIGMQCIPVQWQTVTTMSLYVETKT